MTQSVFGDRDHSDAAAALLALGQLHLQEQDFTQAKYNLEKSFENDAVFVWRQGSP